VLANLNIERARELTNGEVEVVNDANLVVNNPDIDIVIELIGGYGIAKDLTESDCEWQTRCDCKQGIAGNAWQ
jgi:predicted homoserine dehydrogenase-like protein